MRNRYDKFNLYFREKKKYKVYDSLFKDSRSYTDSFMFVQSLFDIRLKETEITKVRVELFETDTNIIPQQENRSSTKQFP